MSGARPVVLPGPERPGLRANSGGPAGRQRSQPVVSSIFGKDDGFVRCPRVISLGLRFEDGDDPVAVIRKLLEEEGFAGPESLRPEFELPAEPLICLPFPYARGRLDVHAGPRREVLRQALMLGLCTIQLYDPGRPVLWTKASLTRALDVFDQRGFYA